MSELQRVRGFEEAWRPPAGRRAGPETVLAVRIAEVRARLHRLVARAPEVMVKVTGRTRGVDHLKAHLAYISRRGALEAEDDRGGGLDRDDLREVAEGWSWAAARDRRRANSPISVSVVLSMPARTDPLALRDAARAFAREVFGETFAYAFVLHTDVGHPHVHLAACARGRSGERLNPKKADLARWRDVFARALRDRGVEAEATPRRARGVVRKGERLPFRKLRERRVARGETEPTRVERSAWRAASMAAFASDAGGDARSQPWEARIARHQARLRRFYLSEARALQRASSAEDRALGAGLEAFVRAMPSPESRQQARVRQLLTRSRAADRPTSRER